MEDIYENEDIILDVKNLEITFYGEFDTTIAVKNISFQLKKGDTLGLVGESGSGKSVTSLSIMRLIQEPTGKITNGQILFRSAHYNKVVDLAKLPKKEMREIRGGDIAMIFQEPMSSLNPVLTCGYQVMESILLHQEDIISKNNNYGGKISKAEAKARTIELFRQVQLVKVDKPKEEQEKELEMFFKKYPHELSGGQKQRVMIAMALSCEPTLLIADEPTTALDVTVQSEILELLRNLRDKHNAAIIFITHDLGVIAEIADEVMVMYKGQVMEKDDVWNIFDNPKSPYTKGLLACRPRLELQMKVLPVVSDFMEVNEFGEVIPKEGNKYGSVGDALLFNFVTEDEILERRKVVESKQPVLEVNNIKTYFPIKKGILQRTVANVKAVDDVSLKVYPGETVGLVGESGCGKTTLGRTILRLIEATEGEILFHGRDVRALSKAELRKLRREMQIIFQDPYSSLNPRLTIGQAITEPMQLHKIAKTPKARKDKAVYLLERVGLSAAHFGRYPHEFSGGQRQRISIARTLAIEPKFIIADESVSALDVSVQAQVLNLLNELKEEFDLTYVFISHDLSVVKFMSDRIIVMNKGKIEEVDYADEIYDKPKTAYTQKLIDSIPKGRLEDIRREQFKRREYKEQQTTND